jgi:hypothetical protein
MSDIMFLAKKEYDNKTLDDSGNLTTTGVLCEFDVPDGKTFYLAYANAWINDLLANGNDKAEIKLEEDFTATDTQVGETKHIGNASSTADNAVQQGTISALDLFSEFKGAQIFVNNSGAVKKVRLRVSANTGTSDVRGTIRGWTETNGTDPVI